MISVYLDSSDYSELSKENFSPEYAQIKNDLLEMAAKGAVRFMFSSVVVCEVAPVGAQAVPYAIRRGGFLQQLCQGNALVDLATLYECEARALTTGQTVSRQSICGARDWFPAFELDEPTPLHDAMLECLRADPDFQKLPRERRREIERKLTKKGTLRPEVESMIRQGVGQLYVDAIARKYPMESCHAEVLRRYALSEASKEEATEAFKTPLRDPGKLMRWFTENPELAKPLTEIVRRPGREMGANLRAMVQAAERMKEIDAPESLEAIDGERQSLWDRSPYSALEDWTDRVNRQSISIVEGVGRACGIRFKEAVTAAEISRSCPGIDAVLRSISSSLWGNLSGASKREPSDSQFPDAMHSAYAPYVDVFRADSNMAPHIREQVTRHGTRVVSKLRELPAVLASLQRT